MGSGDVSFKFLVESFPHILSLSVEHHLKPLVKLLEDFGVPKGTVGDVLLLFPSVILWKNKDFRAKAFFFNKVSSLYGFAFFLGL